MSVLTEILTRLLSGWKWVLGAAAGAAVLFYRWRADRNAEKAMRLKDRVDYLEAKETNSTLLQKEMRARKQAHEKERENLHKRRREGRRVGGLGKW